MLLNAAQAIPDGRADAHEIRVSTYVDERGRVIVEVADTFQSSGGRGNVYRVQLPASGGASDAVAPGPPVSAPKRRGKLMVIDDDALLCTLLRRSLQREHDVVCFSDAREALQSIDAGATFDVILCDVMMPHMTGAEFHRELERRHPVLAQRTEFLTGGAFTPAARDFVERLGRSCLEKPLDLRDLRKFINDRVK